MRVPKRHCHLLPGHAPLAACPCSWQFSEMFQARVCPRMSASLSQWSPQARHVLPVVPGQHSVAFMPWVLPWTAVACRSLVLHCLAVLPLAGDLLSSAVLMALRPPPHNLRTNITLVSNYSSLRKLRVALLPTHCQGQCLPQLFVVPSYHFNKLLTCTSCLMHFHFRRT